jgi:hypothetical protein
MHLNICTTNQCIQYLEKNYEFAESNVEVMLPYVIQNTPIIPEHNQTPIYQDRTICLYDLTNDMQPQGPQPIQPHQKREGTKPTKEMYKSY